MSRRSVLTISMAVLVAVVAAGTARSAMANRFAGGTTVIVRCDYSAGGGDADLRIRVGAEPQVAGPQPPPVAIGMTCAEAANLLFDAGFELVHSVQVPPEAPSGKVDLNDLQVWRSRFGVSR